MTAMNSATPPLLQVTDLAVSIATPRGKAAAVDGVSFSIASGEVFALLGESGCGKSMTALSLLRLLPEAARIAGGSVRFNGRELFDVTEEAMRDVRGRGMAMIFQEPATSLNPVMTVGRQIGEVLAAHADLDGSAARMRAVDLLTAVGIPDAQRRLDEYPFQLSGGMKQRVMIAMALAGEPLLLIADEPTTALDVTIQAQVLQLIASLQRSRAMSLLLISHDLGVVAMMADRIGVMYAGVLVEVAPRAAFFANPRHPYTRKLFAAVPDLARREGALDTIRGSVPPATVAFQGCRFAERCDFATDVCRNELPPWHPIEDGHGVLCHYPDAEREHTAGGNSALNLPATSAVPAQANSDETALLEVADLKVHFPIRKGIFKRTVGHVRAVDGVSLSLAAGKTLAVVGESGCGKTTVAKAIVQLLRPSAGRVELLGQDLTALPAGALKPWRARMQMIFQDPYASLNPRLRVGPIIAEGMRALNAVKAGNEGQRIADLLASVGLNPDMAGRYPHEFSGGQRQRIAIARALAVEPQLLVCDEPTSALDVSVQAQILNLLRDLQRRLKLGYVFITHNIAVVDYLAHEVAVMYLGRIVERGTTDEVLRAPRHPYTVALIAAVPSVMAGAARQTAGTTEGAMPPVSGDLPSPAAPPSGCHFHPRCPHVMEICRQEYPRATQLSPTRRVHCHLFGS